MILDSTERVMKNQRMPKAIDGSKRADWSRLIAEQDFIASDCLTC